MTPPRPKRQHLPTADEVFDPAGPARIIVIAGPGTGAVYPVKDRGSVLLGRSEICDGVIASTEISRRHASLRRSPTGQFVIEDHGSRNGTFLNGRPVVEPTPVRFGDQIMLGSKSILLFTHFDSAEEQLLEQQRLELLGRIAAGVAHDLNNLLGAVLATKEYLASLPADRELGSDEVQDCLADIDVAASRATDLTPRLLHFVRGSDAGRVRLDLSAVCHELEQLARRIFDRDITVNATIAPNLFVMGDRGQIHQIALNLLVNARDAMPDGGKLEIEARRATREEVRLYALNQERDYVVLVISDTGKGMDAETKERIFEPFFTTKEGKGFGLGLATTCQLLAAHGGRIDLESELGEGTRFFVFIPEAGAATERTTAPKAPLVAERPRRRSVLLADDDASFSKATARLLRRVGLEVECAKSGRRTLDAYRTKRHDVVLLDLDMPDLRGEEVITLLADLDPKACVIVLSGHSGGARTQQLRRHSPRLDILHKPVSIDELQMAIATAPPLDGEGEDTEEPVADTFVKGLTDSPQSKSSA